MANEANEEDDGFFNDMCLEALYKSDTDISEIPGVPIPSHVFIVEGCPVSRNDSNAPILKSSEMECSLASLSTGKSQNPGIQRGFSIQTLKCCLESCIRADTGEIDLDRYLDTYREICKLMDNLGTVIRTNIGKDIKLKIEIMKEHRTGSNGAFYQTLEKMITYEKVRKIHQKDPDENGSRTILILHRSLNFIIEFLRSLNTLKVEQGVGSIGRDAYNRTLAPFHPWAYRHIARVALSTLGKKGQLISNFHDGGMTVPQVQEMVEEVVKVATLVYNRCQSIYEKNNFLNLP